GHQPLLGAIFADRPHGRGRAPRRTGADPSPRQAGGGARRAPRTARAGRAARTWPRARRAQRSASPGDEPATDLDHAGCVRGRAGRPGHLRGARGGGRGSMSAPQLDRLHAQMVRLRLYKSRERIEALLQEATASELSYADFLDQLLTEEVTSKTSKNV